MKITDPDVIKNGEKDLIEAVKNDLDLDTIKEIMQSKMNPKTLLSKGGEIVVHNNAIAFRLDFSIEISGSLMFDRQGNYIPESDENDGQKSLVAENIDSKEQLNIDLPEYDPNGESDLEDIKQEELNPETDLDPNLDIDPEAKSEAKSESTIDDNDLTQEEIVDEDINDILKESQDFWDVKKNE